MFSVHGDQRFEVWDDVVGNEDQEKISRLIYPYRGSMTVFNGELGFRDKFFLGGRYGNSQFAREICTDEDWNFWAMHNSELKWVDYQVSRQDSRPKVEFFDINLYYRLLDLDGEKIRPGSSYSRDKEILDAYLANALSFDVLVGYQSQKGRYPMMDPMHSIYRLVEGEPWYALGYPADIGLNSFYKISYQGPRVGFRVDGTVGKLNARVNFAGSLLKTKAFGWWNRRDYSFWQTGEGLGYGLDLGTELIYALTPYFSLGLGYDFLYRIQNKLKESGVESGAVYDNLDIIQNAKSKLYGPKLVFRFIW